MVRYGQKMLQNKDIFSTFEGTKIYNVLKKQKNKKKFSFRVAPFCMTGDS